MRIRRDNFMSFREYKDMLERGNYLDFSSGFLSELDGEHIVDIFRDIIERNKLFVTFDEEEKGEYEHRPKNLSKELYGTPDLYFIIMKLNNITHPAEFEIDEGIYLMHQDNVSLLTSSIQDLLDYI